MVRFLKGQLEEFLPDDDLDRVIAMENITSLLYIPASILISMDVLGKYEIIPYMGNYRWRLLLPACIYLALANVRDLQICARNFLVSSDDSVTHKTLVGHMQITSSLLMTLGSLSLLNASIFGLLHSTEKPSNVLASAQYVASFGFFICGCAANTVPLHPEFAEYDASRAMLTFLHIMACVLLCAEGLLMLPGLIEQDIINLRDFLVRVFAVSASVILMFSSVVNYFHTIGMLRTARNLTRAGEEQEYTRKEVNIDESGRKTGFFDKMLRLFSSGSMERGYVSSHAKYPNLETEHPYEDQALVMSDASSSDLEWGEVANARNVRDREGGRYRTHSEGRKHRDPSRKKKRKARKR